MAILPKAIYRFKAYQNSNAVLQRNGNTNHMKEQNTVFKTIPNNNSAKTLFQVGVQSHSNKKSCLLLTFKNRQIHQRRKTEDQYTSPGSYTHVKFLGTDHKYSQEKKKWCWSNRVSTCKRMKLHSYLSSFTKLKFEME